MYHEIWRKHVPVEVQIAMQLFQTETERLPLTVRKTEREKRYWILSEKNVEVIIIPNCGYSVEVFTNIVNQVVESQKSGKKSRETLL